MSRSPKPARIEPAQVDFGDPLSPSAPRFGDLYHARQGAFAQAGHVFLAGNGLPARWRGVPAFTILETGFGLGNNFLATWQAWRSDESADRALRLRFISLEKHPLRREDLERAHAASPAPALARALLAAWPPLTPGLHCLSFDDDRVELLLYLGDAAEGLREIVANVDAFFLDGFAPARNRSMWNDRVWRPLARLAAPGATAATWSAATWIREGLARAAFDVRSGPGTGGKREITLARHVPRVAPRRPAARVGRQANARVAIVGAGIAGAMAARALARQGMRVDVFEAAGAPAAGASGHPAALVHGTFHPDNGLHARALRAAALLARRVYAKALDEGVPGCLDGLLRVVGAEASGEATPREREARAFQALTETGPAEPLAAPSTKTLQPLYDALDALDARPSASQSLAIESADADLARALGHSGLPPEFVQAWTARQVMAAGGPLRPAAFYPGGGWVAPLDLVQWALREPGVSLHPAARVTALRRDGSGDATHWTLIGGDGRILHETECVIVCGGIDAPALLAASQSPAAPIDMRAFESLVATRGQLSMLAAGTSGLSLPRLPVAGGGYVIRLPDGGAVFGATSHPDDDDPSMREADHRHNLAQLAALTASDVGMDVQSLVGRGRLTGRVGWRAVTPDRLPWIGAVPAAWSPSPTHRIAEGKAPRFATSPPDQPRHWPRVPGLFVLGGLGSRGMTWAPLAARLLASWILDIPFPAEATLVDAFDPARACTRAVRRARAAPAAAE